MSSYHVRLPGNDQVTRGNRRLPGTAGSQAGQRWRLKVTTSYSRIHEDCLRRINNESRTLENIPDFELIKQIDGYILARALQRSWSRYVDTLVVVDLLCTCLV